jgi:ElaB/YqjD/DUF883 family membrane-anchored ribosome-binding protein
MSENRTPGGYTPGQGGQATGGAGTGATDAGTTRDASTGGVSGNNQGLTTTGQGTGGGAGAGTAPAQDKGYGAKIAEAASTAKDYLGDKVSAIGDKLSDLKNTDIKEVANQAKDYARQNPGQAILISAAAGLVLGMLIRGSRR